MDTPTVVAIVDLGFVKNLTAWLEAAKTLLKVTKTHRWLGVQLRTKVNIGFEYLEPIYAQHKDNPSCHWNLFQPLPGPVAHQHLPQNRQVESALSFSRSIHRPNELKDQRPSPLWFQLAPIYPPTHKPGHPLGLSQLKKFVAESPRPIVAVGGVNSKNARQIANAGAAGVGCIGSILSSSSPVDAAVDIYKNFKGQT